MGIYPENVGWIQTKSWHLPKALREIMLIKVAEQLAHGYIAAKKLRGGEKLCRAVEAGLPS